MCAWSDCFVNTDTGEPFGGTTAGSGSPVSRGSIEPSSSSSRSVRPSPIRPPTPTTMRSGRYQRSMNDVNVSRVAARTVSFVPMMSRPSGWSP